MHSSTDIRSAGLACFPCDPKRKAPLVSKGESWQTVGTRPLEQLRTSPVWGVPVPEGVIVIDLDKYKGVTREAVEALTGPLAWDQAYIQSTQNGGEHYAFRAPSWPVRQTDSHAGLAGFDTRTGGKGYIATGQGYTPGGMFGVLSMASPAMLPPLPDTARGVLEAKKPGTPVTQTAQGASDRQIREALAHIDPECSRSQWVRIGLALKSHAPDTGLAIFDEWSRGDLTGGVVPTNYYEDGQAHQWGSFKPEGGITIGTLFYEASRAGWTPPPSFDVAGVFGGGQVGAIDDILEHGADPKETKRLAALAGSDPLLCAVLARELKEAGLLTKRLSQALTPDPTTPRGKKPEAGSVLPWTVAMSPELWHPGQTKGKERRPRGTIDNFVRMLAAYGVDVQYNEMSKETYLSGPGVPIAGAMFNEAALSFIDHLANLNDYPKNDARSMITIMANRNAFNPVTQYVESAPWDGGDYIAALFNCLQLAPEEDRRLTYDLFRRWFLGAVAIGTGFTRSLEFVLVLVDPDGGTGKTRFFETLAPDTLRKTSVLLDVADRDSVKLATGYWLTELGELDGTFTRSEHARLKAFLSSEFDEMRLPYARTYIKHPRRTAFFASVNSTTFLTDSSGNRRYWPIRITGVDYQHKINVQQAWAQAWAYVQAGHTWHLTPEDNKVVAARNDEFRTRSRVEDGLSVVIDREGTPDQHMTASMVLVRAGIPNANKSEINEAANWLRKAGYREIKRGGVRGFMIPAVSPATVAGEFKRGVGS